MGKFIPTYKQTKNKVIKICMSCNHVEELTEATMDCPSCKMVNMFFWENATKFQYYVQRYKPTNLKVVGEHLQYLVDEALEEA